MSIALGPVALSNLRGVALSLSNQTHSFGGLLNVSGNLMGADSYYANIQAAQATVATATLGAVTAENITLANVAAARVGTFDEILTIPYLTDINDTATLSSTPDGSVCYNETDGPQVVISGAYQTIHADTGRLFHMNRYGTSLLGVGFAVLSGVSTRRAEITLLSDESWTLSCPTGFVQISNVSVTSRLYVGLNSETTMISGGTVQPNRVIFGTANAPNDSVTYQLYPSLSKLVYRTNPHVKYIDGTTMYHVVHTSLSAVNLAANTFTNMFAANPVLSAGHWYDIEFNTALRGLSDSNGAMTYLLLSAGTGLAFTTVLGTYRAGHGHNSTSTTFLSLMSATTTVNTLSNVSFPITVGADNVHTNRWIEGRIRVNVTATGALYIQYAQDAGPSTPWTERGSFVRVYCLGTNGADYTEGSYV